MLLRPAYQLHWTTRALALFVVCWLWMMPQVLNSRNSATVLDEFGTRPLPIAEEEEVKLACAKFQWQQEVRNAERELEAPPLRDDRVEASLHGDVPLRPPRHA
ncbi:MAG: hypothetical protein R2815_09210 [Flavobacteriales bacterium]